MTTNDWLAVLSQAGRKNPDVIPTGFKTIEQIAKETGKSLTMTRMSVKEALNQGLVEEVKLKIGTDTHLYPTAHYRIIPRNEYGSVIPEDHPDYPY